MALLHRSRRRATFRLWRGVHRIAFAIGIVVIFGSTSDGQPMYQVLVSFNDSPAGYPLDELTQAAGGTFYGTTNEGGAAGQGSIFKVDVNPDGTARLRTIHSFNRPDGAQPRAGLVQGRDGHFYGTTFFGGPFDAGTIFRITAAGTLTTLHQFAPPDAGLPAAALILARNGKFYGTTIRGGPCDCGTLFEMDALGTVRTLHTFNGADGARPFGRLFEARDGTFIGTTFGGGAFDAGTIYRANVAGRVTTIHSFSAADGYRCRRGRDRGERWIALRHLGPERLQQRTRLGLPH